MKCYECLRKDCCPYIYQFNHNTNVGCTDFQDRDHTTYISNTLNTREEKMSKELEAVNKVKKFKDDCCMFGSSDIEIDRELDIIEAALKRLEGYENHTTFTMVNQINALREENDELRKRLNEMCELREQYHLDQKKLKAYEIIVEKDIDIQALKFWNKIYKGKLSFQEYLRILEDCDLGGTLIQEEYDILKEVLL